MEKAKPESVAKDVTSVTVMSMMVRSVLEELGVCKDIPPEMVDQIIVTQVLRVLKGGEQ